MTIDLQIFITITCHVAYLHISTAVFLQCYLPVSCHGHTMILSQAYDINYLKYKVLSLQQSAKSLPLHPATSNFSSSSEIDFCRKSVGRCYRIIILSILSLLTMIFLWITSLHVQQLQHCALCVHHSQHQIVKVPVTMNMFILNVSLLEVTSYARGSSDTRVVHS